MCDQKINLMFVEEIEKHECLFNNRIDEYSRKDITEKAWQEVAEKVNMTAAECKEKWRNLRTVFMRKMKSGANRKPYYMAQAMQFCLPYIKTACPPSENATAPSTQSPSPPLAIPSETHTQKRSTGPVPSSSRAGNNAQRKRSAADADQCVAEHLKAKTSRLEATTTECAKKEALKMFLLSLMPELEEFSDAQIKVFKRRVFSVIDDISQPTETTL